MVRRTRFCRWRSCAAPATRMSARAPRSPARAARPGRCHRWQERPRGRPHHADLTRGFDRDLTRTGQTRSGHGRHTLPRALQTGSQGAIFVATARGPRALSGRVSRPIITRSDPMDLRDTIRTYRLFSGSYDAVFGAVFQPGRKEAVRIANDRPGQRILEVGVGTGLSLPYFRPDSHLTGVDISAEMLAKARRRVEKQQLTNVEELHVMDAEHLDFEDNSFDAVLALYVASVVPSPARFAAEMRRVCIPGGTIVLVNHFTSENWALRWMEKRLAHLARHIGFHADFPLDAFLRDSELTAREIRPSNLFGYWRLLRCINEKPASTI